MLVKFIKKSLIKFNIAKEFLLEMEDGLIFSEDAIDLSKSEKEKFR